MTKPRFPRIRVLTIAVPSLIGLTECKGEDTGPRTSTETHFLTYCGGNCGNGLSCLCGVCTRACTEPLDCASLDSKATCTPGPGATRTDSFESCGQSATCEVSCVTSADCESIGADYRCETGVCRTGQATCPTSVILAGDHLREIVVDGSTRAYTLHVPSNYSGAQAVPLVLDFHPSDLGLDWERSNSGYEALSDSEGFLLVWPQGLENSWNIGPCCTTSKTHDDFAFARAIVRQLSVETCVDPKRVYAVGFSMGGAMAQYLGCRHAEVFASVASSSMDLAISSEVNCDPSRAVTEISFRGDADTIVPYAGGTTSPPGHPELSFTVMGAKSTFERWAAINQCEGSPTASGENGCLAYRSCAEGSEVVLCTIAGGGQVVGDANLAWSVLKQHPMP